MTGAEHHRKGQSSGFSLIEVLVALAILSLGLTLAFTTLSQGLTTASRLRDRAELTLTAENLLYTALARRALSHGVETGTMPGGLTWRLEVTALDDEPFASGLSGPLPYAQEHALYAVEVQVERQDTGARVVLNTLKTAELPL